METVNNNSSNSKHKFNNDILLWLLVWCLLIGGIFANYYFGELSWALRFAGWILLVCALVGLVAITDKGKKLWKFAKDARIELLKVVWPKREETMKITMVIAIMVVATSMVLWGVDTILLWLVGLLVKAL
jgi:preprotein translocase subunit SecE